MLHLYDHSSAYPTLRALLFHRQLILGKADNFIKDYEFTILLSKNFFKELTEKMVESKNNFESSCGWADLSLAFGKKEFQDELRKVSSYEEVPELEKKLNQLNKDGHAIAYRIDNKHKRIALFDPNVGYFSFDNVPDGEAKLAECLNRLLSLFYKNLVLLGLKVSFSNQQIRRITLLYNIV